ncbi:F-box/FBD/LRR-repeat protein-like protein [Tanacetum coccineum]
MKGARGRVHRSRKASKLEPKDYISTMPEEVITNILHCLPLHDIMKTKEKDYEGIIDELLHLLNGAITEFVLYMPYTIKVDVINDWIIYLSKKGIKEFAFKDVNREELELTPHLFSCLELTHLELDHCALRLPSEFGGFPKLLRLYLSDVTFIGYNGWEFLTRSPLVEILKLYLNGNGKLKHAEIAKLENLKSLSLYVSVHKCDPYEDSSSEVDFRRMVQLQLLRKVKLAGIRAGNLKGRRKFERKLRKIWNIFNFIIADATKSVALCRLISRELAFYGLWFMARWIARREIARPPVLLSADEGLVVITAGRIYNSNLFSSQRYLNILHLGFPEGFQ